MTLDYLKAGDIVLSRSTGFSSKFIQFVTNSDWSHVGIAIGADGVLEATPESVGVVPIEKFAKDKERILVFSRPRPLTSDQVSRLTHFSQRAELKDYSKFQAGLTMLGAAVWAFVIGSILVSAVVLLNIARDAGAGIGVYLLSLIYVSTILVCWAVVFLWSSRTGIGVKATERLLNRSGFGRRLLRKRHDMFCSKLVALAECEIEGELAELLSLKDEVTPRHVEKACRDFEWPSSE